MVLGKSWVAGFRKAGAAAWDGQGLQLTEDPRKLHLGKDLREQVSSGTVWTLSKTCGNKKKAVVFSFFISGAAELTDNINNS